MNLTIIKHEGGAYIDSREIAEFIGKRHRTLIRDIFGYIKYMRNFARFNFEPSDFFVESTYTDNFGFKQTCYLVSKVGCELLMNRLNGEKAIAFTAAYVAKFSEYEAAEREAEKKFNAKTRLSEFNSAVKNVLNGMAQSYAKPEQVMDFLAGVYEPLGIKVMDENSNFNGKEYYSATSIAKMFGILSHSGRPHAHAVAAIITKIDNWAEHAIAIPYGLIGVMIRYDMSVVNAVQDWLKSYNYPNTVPYLNFEYHIYSKRTADFYTEEELNEMCGEYDECELCPGRFACSGG